MATNFGWLVGIGPGAGIALMFVGTELLGSALSFAGYLVPAVHNIEEELADHLFVASSVAEVQPV